MAVFHVVLWNLTLVGLHLLGQKIHREMLLQDGVSFVFFVSEDTLNCARPPLLLSGRSGHI